MKKESVILPVTLNLIGSIIGAGVFGLPAVFSRTGVLGGTILFFIILGVVAVLNLFYLKIIYWVGGAHRMPGYIGRILGDKARWFALASMFGKTAGTSLAYIILGGVFLSMLFDGLGKPYPAWTLTLIFWAAGSIVVFYGAKLVKEIESDLTWLLIGFMFFSVLVLLPFMNWKQAATVNVEAFFGSLGIIFFATTAMTVLPEVAEIAGKRHRDAHIGVISAILSAGLISWLFGVSIASAYPHVQSVRDIQYAFPQIFWWLIPMIGLLAVGTSFITFTQSLKNLIHVDLGVQAVPSWILSVVAPVILYAIVSRDFLTTIGFVGGVLTTFNGLLVCAAAYVILQKPLKREVSILRFAHFPDGIRKTLTRIWNVLPIPIALILVLVIIEHLLTLFH